jgi:hypothetical protein
MGFQPTMTHALSVAEEWRLRRSSVISSEAVC